MKSFRFVPVVTVLLFIFALHLESNPDDNTGIKHIEKSFRTATIENKLQTGDVILRSGKSFISDVLRQFSLKDKKYSHAGIISIEKDTVFVYHILGGESESGKQVRKEFLGSFCIARDNNAVAIYRYDLKNNEKKNIFNYLQLLLSKKIVFDSHFDLATDSAMYCTELVYKVVEDSGEKGEHLTYSVIEGNKYIAPDNLYMNPHSTLIYSFEY